jgi:short-subunit dehydrogenase
MRDRYGPWALVAGASDGIGAAFATELAARGLDVVMVARRAEPLRRLAGQIGDRYGVATRAIPADLGTPSGLDSVLESTSDVGVLVCNAASAPISPYADLTAAQLATMLDLNCRSSALLTHALGSQMLARGRGGVILLSSAASFQGANLVAHYAATKAYLRVLAEGLWYEWRPRGVDVLACCPGLVATPTYQRSRATPGRLVPPAMSAESVARRALAALGRTPVVVPGWRNSAAMQAATRLLPRRLAIAMTSSQTAAMYRDLTG